MTCPRCKKKIKGANKTRTFSIWYHKLCPGTISYRRKNREKLNV